MKLFVAMPYGRNVGRLDPEDAETAREIEFDEVWNGVIRPAIPAEWEVVRAEEYYRRAINVATSQMERAMAQRSFAFFLFSQGRLQEARALYEDALTHETTGDSFAHQMDGYTLQGWAWNEAFIAGNAARAADLFARAEAEFQAIDNPMTRSQLLGGLNAARHGAPASPDAASGLKDWLKKATT